jgi:SAM-dependent methyltransferase
LYVGGLGVTRGYLDDPVSTAQAFVPNPFGDREGSRLYRTGDRVRFLPDGNVEFLGRVDNQIKLRGFRIEPGEIENVLVEHPRVEEAVVVPRDEANQEKRLVAYVAVRQEPEGEGSLSNLEDNRVSQWQMIYEEEIFNQALADQDPTFNIRGWNSSFTGEPIADVEMREWVDATAKRILDLRPKQVLEIGCGSGLILFPVAPHCEAYWATDFSRAALDHVGRVLAMPGQDLSQVKLCFGEAHRLAELPDRDLFDTVILNSVVQYFPSIGYLVQVLESALQRVVPGGAIFVGDVRSLPLLEAFHLAVQRQRTRNLSSTRGFSRPLATGRQRSPTSASCSNGARQEMK